MRLFSVLLVLVLTALGFGQNPTGPAMRPQLSAQEQAKATATLKNLEKEYTVAKAAYSKKPKDKKARDRFVSAGTKFGHESMMSPVLSARVKYRQALKIYREVLKVDPNNPVAKPESNLIIGIYKSMGRPIPK